MSRKIIFSTGGTGGHIFPAVNLMEHFFEKGYEVVLVTDDRGKNFIKENTKFTIYTLKTSTLTNKNIFNKIFSLFIIFYSILKAFVILKKEKPDLIFGFGGYVSFPISFTSKFFNLPLIIYENNLIIGRANKYLLPFVKKILIAQKITQNLPKKYIHKFIEVGSILSKKITNYDFQIKKNNENFSVLILGGSQGAEIFGKIIPRVIKMIKDKGYSIEIYQQCIRQQKDFLSSYYTENEIKNYIFEFDEDILKLTSRSNLAITRCGASTTAELVNTLTPFIAVPLPHSIDNHQYLNAKYYEDRGCCWLLEQHNFTTKNLFDLIIQTITDKKKLEKICENMKKNLSNNVYSNIDREIKEFI